MNSSLDISKIVAGISFILGSLFLVLFLFFKESSIIMFGLYYVLIAFIINTLTFFLLITRLIIRSENEIKLLKAIGPIFISTHSYWILFYCNQHLLNHAKIQF
ncbi:MAG: hypothetical protein COA88_03960 [Kordia sp.]|nr:MAG: hypothetical protein COA88_03960 [Kordia sp.]